MNVPLQCIVAWNRQSVNDIEMLNKCALFFLLTLGLCYGHFYGNTIKVDPGPSVIGTKGEVWPKPQQQAYYDGYMIVRPNIFQFRVCIQLLFINLPIKKWKNYLGFLIELLLCKRGNGNEVDVVFQNIDTVV